MLNPFNGLRLSGLFYYNIIFFSYSEIVYDEIWSEKEKW